jgi:hypothetical protein
MMFNIMSKGAWIVVGVFFLFGVFVPWTYKCHFLKGNVWCEQRIIDATPIETKVDFLGYKAAEYVDRSMSSLLSCLLIAFVYMAVQNKRLERRLIDLEERVTREKPS